MKTEQNSKDMKKQKIVIIGAGISGLTLGWNLSKNGFLVTILEKQKFPGGLATSIEQNGYIMDIGPHYVALPKKSEVTSEINQLMGDENIIELPNDIFQRFYKTNFNRKLYPAYPSLFEVVFNSGFSFLIKSLRSLLVAKIKNFSKKNFQNSEDYIVSHYGNFLYNIWFKPYLYRRYLDEEPPVENVMKQFPVPSFTKILFTIKKKSILENKEKDKENTNEDDNLVFYFKGGMGAIIKRLVNEIEKNNGKIELGVNVQKIMHEVKPKKIIYLKNEKEIIMEADSIVYSTPLDLTRTWFDNIPKNIKKNPPSGIHCMMVFLMIDSKNLFDSWVVNFYDKNIIFSRIAQQNFLSDSVVPKNKSLLSVEIRTTEDSKLWNMDETSLVQNIKNDLQKSGILNNQSIDDFKILKLKNLYSNSTQTKDKNSREQMIKYVRSFDNEFTSVTESDSGILAAGGTGNNTSSKITHGAGIYMSFYKSALLAREINNEFE